MRILISGAGVGGLALAGFLKESGIECTIIDKTKDWQHGGFSIGLWSNGRHMLKKLGVGEQFDRASMPIKKIRINSSSGKLIKEYPLDKFDIDFGMSVVHVMRQDLHDWLFEAAGKPNIVMNCCVEQIENTPTGASVVFNDKRQEKFDLVVGADGVHSEVRTLLFGTKERYINWRAWWAWVPGQLCEPHTIVEYVGAGGFIVLFTEGERTLAVLMAPAEHSVWDEEKGRLDRLKKIFDREFAAEPRLYEGLSDTTYMPSDLMVVETPLWQKDSAVLIGDAAHALPPFAAIGASMALEDAYVLAAELMKSSDNIPRALEAYEKRRRPRLRRVELLTNRLQMISTVSSPFLRSFLNFGMSLVPQKLATADYRALMKEEL